MQNEVVDKMKEEFEKRKKSKERCQKMVVRVNELREEPLVKEYLKLISLLDNIDSEVVLNWDDDDMVNKAFCMYKRDIIETNGIYVCMGTFQGSIETDIEHGASDYRLSKNDSNAEYRIYRNLETEDDIRKKIEDCKKFEEENTVIYPKTLFAEKAFYELQSEFISDVVRGNQEVAVAKIFQKTNINVKYINVGSR